MTEHETVEEQVNSGSKNLLKAYFNDTHNLLYSYLLSLPLLLLYEAFDCTAIFRANGSN